MKCVRKKGLKLDLLASVLIATSIFAATLQKTTLLKITHESYCWKRSVTLLHTFCDAYYYLLKIVIRLA